LLPLPPWLPPSNRTRCEVCEYRHVIWGIPTKKSHKWSNQGTLGTTGSRRNVKWPFLETCDEPRPLTIVQCGGWYHPVENKHFACWDLVFSVVDARKCYACECNVRFPSVTLYIYIYDISSLRVNDLTLIPLTWREWWAPNNASK